DIIAGLTLALTVIPQSMAYAKIAELPTQYGLYTSFVCYFVYCLLGTARDVNLGPTAVLSLLTAEFTHQIPQLASLLALVCGVVQLIMGLLNIGFVMEFISHTIINSFTTAAALAIMFSQIKKWLGLKNVPREFIKQLYWTVMKIPEAQWYDCSLGFVCMVFLYLLKASMHIYPLIKSLIINNIIIIIMLIIILPTLARNALTISIASSLAAILLRYDLQPFTLTGNITSGIPTFGPPSFAVHIPETNTTLTVSETFQKLGIGSVITPLVGLIEIVAIGKAFAKKNKYRIDSNQEFLASGTANLIGSFVQAYPVTGSFSRSAVASQSGIRTPAANVITGILVLLSLQFLTPMFYYIPTSGLAAVIIMAVLDLIDFSLIKQLWIINSQCLTLCVCVCRVCYGILIGVAVSLLFLLYPWAKPKIEV
ncbi:hypothetical protein HELRODRAFT_130656, partial [Helobdella robusta]|uniref:SLC26A/SulP transporter domain-containing protein n=1 Tax=Helobdella robusta TaxID=6412 RepID=T1EHU4_HELRO